MTSIPKSQKALILVDLQIDFLPIGALPTNDGDAVIPIANELMDQFELVVATQDWHPANHKSFAAMHPWRKPGQVIDLNGLSQVLWPIHCVQESFGADFAPGLNTAKITKIIQKGTDPEIDSYSGFFDNGHRKATGLEDYLKQYGIKHLVIMGLATDYCVKHTVIDALDLGFSVEVIERGIRAVNLEEGDGDRAIKEMKDKGAVFS